MRGSLELFFGKSVCVCVWHDQVIGVCNYFYRNRNIVSLYLHKLNVDNHRLKQFILCLSDCHTNTSTYVHYKRWNDETTKNDKSNSILNYDKFPLMSPKFIYYMNDNKKRRRRRRRQRKWRRRRQQLQWNKNDNNNEKRSHIQTFVF